MNKSEAQKFLNKIKSGYYFVTRYQDQEWSIKFVDGQYVMIYNSMNDEPEVLIKTENQLLFLLSRYNYSYQYFSKKLRRENKRKFKKDMKISDQKSYNHPFWNWFMINEDNLKNELELNPKKVQNLISKKLSEINKNITFSLKIKDDNTYITISPNGIHSAFSKVKEIIEKKPQDLPEYWIFKKHFP